MGWSTYSRLSMAYWSCLNDKKFYPSREHRTIFSYLYAYMLENFFIFSSSFCFELSLNWVVLLSSLSVCAYAQAICVFVFFLVKVLWCVKWVREEKRNQQCSRFYIYLFRLSYIHFVLVSSSLHSWLSVSFFFCFTLKKRKKMSLS
jgi:hypothetical protein